MDEARLLAERMFYMLKRGPTLLRWQVDTLKEDIFTALDDRMKQADATVANVRAVVSEANELVTSLGPPDSAGEPVGRRADGDGSRAEPTGGARCLPAGLCGDRHPVCDVHPLPGGGVPGHSAAQDSRGKRE